MLLSSAHDSVTLAPILAALRFAAARQIDADDRARLGLGALASEAWVARGDGALRALIITPRAGMPARHSVGLVAERLARRAPHLLWLLIAVDSGEAGGSLALAAWSADRVPPRVAALIVDRAHVVESDADTIVALEAAAAIGPTDPDGALTHTRWIDILGREGLGRRFHRAVARAVDALAAGSEGRAAASERHEIALLYTCRLLFLAFLEAKGWLDGDRAFLGRAFDRCVAGAGGVHARVLLPLFFGTLNTPPHRRAARARAFGRIPFLNGGLFAPAPVERRRGIRFTDAALGVLFGDVLPHFRFRPHEDHTESAIDPAMLGRTFESLMETVARRTSGTYYTPRALVDTAVVAAIAQLLTGDGLTAAEAEAFVRGGPVAHELSDAMRARLGSVRVLDPACGSGAFLVHVLETLAALAARLGDTRPLGELRAAILTQSIFGVDTNPTAVWLCELRLWLSVVIESEVTDPLAVSPLPNLDRNVRVGNSLAGGGASCTNAPGIALLRRRYVTATGTRKRAVAMALDRAERAVAIAHVTRTLQRVRGQRADLLAAGRGRDLFGHHVAPHTERLTALRTESRALRRQLTALRDGAALPFAYAVQFAEAALGFDAIVGNPPWVRLHNIPASERERLRAGFRTFREAAWMHGARLARAGQGFGSQVDLAALFAERAVSLCRPGGVIALLVPAKLFRALAGGGFRALLRRDTRITAIEDWSDAEPAFDAAVYPALVVARRADPAGTRDAMTRVAVHQRGGRARRWVAPVDRLALDATDGCPWALIPPAVRGAFDAVVAAGVPMHETRFGAPWLGVKSGLNAAFVVTTADDGENAGDPASASGITRIVGRGERGAPRCGLMETALLRPLIRGETITPWVARGRERLVWAHDAEVLPEHAARWLAPWRHRLRARSDTRGGRWWRLFRAESADARHPRVVWADIGRSPRAAVLPAGCPSVALNSCYLARCPDLGDALAFAALLNGPLAAAWLNAIAEPARGGWRRYLGWTVGLLPIPRDWPRARRRLSALGERAIGGEIVGLDELWDAAVDAYRLPPAAVAPLAAWVLGPSR